MLHVYTHFSVLRACLFVKYGLYISTKIWFVYNFCPIILATSSRGGNIEVFAQAPRVMRALKVCEFTCSKWAIALHGMYESFFQFKLYFSVY